MLTFNTFNIELYASEKNKKIQRDSAERTSLYKIKTIAERSIKYLKSTCALTNARPEIA